MNKIRKYIGLPSTEKTLLLRTGALVALVRLGLWLLPFKTLERLLRIRIRSSCYARHSVDRLVWAVRVVSRYIPCASCLTQSVALQYLLERSRYPSHIQIGVVKHDDGTFGAHAWVESNGTVLLNTAADVAQYVRLVSLGCLDQ